MRNTAMTDTARLMNDLYEELTEVYEFMPVVAGKFVVAAFTGRHQKS